MQIFNILGDTATFIRDTVIKVAWVGVGAAGVAVCAAGVLYSTKPDERALRKRIENDIKLRDNMSRFEGKVVSAADSITRDIILDDYGICNKAYVRSSVAPERVYIGAFGIWFLIS